MPLSMYQQAEHYGVAKVRKAYWKSVGLAAFAGAFIALAFVFYITVTTGTSGAWGLVRLTGGLAFSLGLILVVICGGELFTSTVLSSVAWAQRLVSTKELLVCWSRVYIGNFIGAMLMLLLITSARMYELDGGQWGINALKIAQHKLHHGWVQAFALGVLCNMLVCLGVWMTFASKDALTKAILLMLPVAMFVSSGFEHSIANLFMVPLGIVITNFASVEFFEAAGITAAQFSDLTLANFIWNNLIPVTLGNIVGGGLLVGLGYWIIERKPHKTSDLHVAPPLLAECLAPLSTKKIQPLDKTVHEIDSLLATASGDLSMPKSIQKLNVSDVINSTPFTLTPELSVYEGLKRLSDSGERGAPVVDKEQRLLGYISQQDLLRSLWSEEYVRGISYKVADLMQTQVLTVALNDAVADLIELMVVDRSKLFPVSEMGILTGNTFASYEERLRQAHANKPSSFPVVDEGKLVGVITREAIAAKVCAVYA
ncbi:formate transporter FocA [Shewanella psychrotolerans]|uniref:formate transporter FocA n=1 Tax=Shewanella psychrotolerans TaxID=2864206 RepID=UPI001C66123E|nr:formate transporter FocA [Shewanella psychrotolerans]QYK03251.1 formate transporter FocA [Shewanella psychrotolerans]